MQLDFNLFPFSILSFEAGSHSGDDNATNEAMTIAPQSGRHIPLPERRSADIAKLIHVCEAPKRNYFTSCDPHHDIYIIILLLLRLLLLLRYYYCYYYYDYYYYYCYYYYYYYYYCYYYYHHYHYHYHYPYHYHYHYH